MPEENKKRPSKVAQKQLTLRSTFWPNLDENRLWVRLRSDGWLSVPRAMPLLMQIMDELSKGKPISSTYFELWCRTYDDSFIAVNKSREMAFFSGFTGERAERTWASRINILADLGFIDIAAGSNGPISYILIYNPYQVVKVHADAGRVSAATYNALRQRMLEIGANDLDSEMEKAPERLSPTEKKKRYGEILTRRIRSK